MIDSYETEELIKLIDKKKDYLLKIENPQQAKYLQKEIMFLKNNILPILMRETQILHAEVANWVVKCLDETYKSKYAEIYNGVVFYLHFSDEPKGKRKILKVPVFSTIGEENIYLLLNVRDIPTVTGSLEGLKSWAEEN